MALKPLQPNPKPSRLTACHRHPDLPIATGLCAPCLRERLCLLNPSSSSSGDPSSSAAVATTSLPELRRCKTFSANNCDSVVGISGEPRRRSCDVRARDTLSTLFDLDDDDDGSRERLKVESKNLGFLRQKGTCPVLEEEEDASVFQEVRVSDLPNVGEFEESKTMKEFIDLEFQGKSKQNSNRKDFKEIAGSFRVAASVFSKKLRKWRKKQGTSRRDSDNTGDGDVIGLGEMRLDRLRGRRLRESQSEVGEYGFGRRSCDVDPRGSLDFGRASIDCGGFGRKSCDSDPRFSIDLGRASIDCGRISIDEGRSSFDVPRASWDGYLIGGRTLPHHGTTPVVSVIENAMASVYGFDNRVLSEGKTKVENSDATSLHRRKKGFDRSNSLKRELRVAENEEARVSPAAIGIFNGTKLLITEKELKEWRLNSSSLKDDNSSESFETASKDLTSVSSSSNEKGGFKKCRQWNKLWNMWGLLNRRKSDKCGHEEKLETGNVEDSNTVINGNEDNMKLVRSHSISSSRGSMTSRTQSNSKAIVALQRNRSARYSPNRLDNNNNNNGLLRFYLTPLRSRRRSSNLGKSRLKKSRSLARSVLRL